MHAIRLVIFVFVSAGSQMSQHRLAGCVTVNLAVSRDAIIVDSVEELSVINAAMKRYTQAGFTQGSLSKIQGLFKVFSRLFYSFQGLKS